MNNGVVTGDSNGPDCKSGVKNMEDASASCPTIEKLANKQKNEFLIWAKQELKSANKSRGDASNSYDMIKKRVLAIYDDIIKRQSEIITMKANMKWHAEWIASLTKNIKDIEKTIGIIEPRSDQKIQLKIQDDL